MVQKLEVYDPPMCCDTGVCGPFVDTALVHFAADIDLLMENGVKVDRYNLTRQPDAFVGNKLLVEAMKKEGTECLPIIIADGKIVSQGSYPKREARARIAGLRNKQELT
jgi:hypothetical protein